MVVQKKINIELKDRYIEFFKNLDITIVEISDLDELIREASFFEIELNYMGYQQFKNIDVFIPQYSYGNLSFSRGKIIEIINNYEFKHSVSTFIGSSCSPIIIAKTLKVIGIHESADEMGQFNVGIFIGEILGEMLKKNKLKKENNKTNENPIAVVFTSISPQINYAISCYESDYFSIIENRLYEEYPELKTKNIYFLSCGTVVDKTTTLKKNKIKNSSSIVINFLDENNSDEIDSPKIQIEKQKPSTEIISKEKDKIKPKKNNNDNNKNKNLADNKIKQMK